MAAFTPKMPELKYTTAMDVYTGISVTFDFLAVAECTIVAYLVAREENGSLVRMQVYNRCLNLDRWQMTNRTKIYQKL